MKNLIDKLSIGKVLNKEEFIYLLSNMDETLSKYLFKKAMFTAKQQFGNQIYLRGLIEISSYCKCNCYYCGIRRDNKNAQRYRLSKQDILSCCRLGHDLGFRTFVLQGGEDSYFSDELIEDLVSSIKSSYPDSAITLSLGEKSKDSYQRYYDAGADRYLLRHETADPIHYSKLHPPGQTLENRKACLYNLKSIGYQTGTGFMVGSPYQTMKHLAEDLLFIKDLEPEMVGIGPFIPHHDTVFKDSKRGSVRLTLVLMSILRLMIPNLLIPTTTALGSIDVKGRELGILAGANVIMPNLSPEDVRKKYLLYDNKISTGMETAEGVLSLKKSMKALGYEILPARGDFKPMNCDKKVKEMSQ